MKYAIIPLFVLIAGIVVQGSETIISGVSNQIGATVFSLLLDPTEGSTDPYSLVSDNLISVTYQPVKEAIIAKTNISCAIAETLITIRLDLYTGNYSSIECTND